MPRTSQECRPRHVYGAQALASVACRRGPDRGASARNRVLFTRATHPEHWLEAIKDEIEDKLIALPKQRLSTESYRKFAEGPWLTKKAMGWFWDAYLHDISKRAIIPCFADQRQLRAALRRATACPLAGGA